MFRPNKLLLSLSLFLIFLLAYPSLFAQEESITMTTYYPSPYGSYREMRAKRMAVGDTYIEGETYSWDTLPATINADADLVVEGNVGIGTTGPGNVLHLSGLNNTDKTGIIFGDETTPNTRQHKILAQYSSSVATNNALRFLVDDTGGGSSDEIMRITGNGNVGIGTTGPYGKVQVITTSDTTAGTIVDWDARHFVVGASARSGAVAISYNQTSNTGYIMSVRPSGGYDNLVLNPAGGNVGIGTTSPTALYSYTKVLEIADASGYAAIKFNSAASPTLKLFQIGVGVDSLQFYDGTASAERMRIDKNGNVGIGTTAPTYKLSIVSPDLNAVVGGISIQGLLNDNGGEFIAFKNAAGTTEGSITKTNSTTVAYNTTSDRRLKNDLGLVTDLSSLRALKIHDFNWIGSGVKDRGLFAQEAYDLYPLAITKGTDELNKDGQLLKPWSTDYSKFVPDIIVGWQQHDTQIQELDHRVKGIWTTEQGDLTITGNVGIGTTSPAAAKLVIAEDSQRILGLMNTALTNTYFRFEVNGNAYADGTWSGGGADVAEYTPTLDKTLEPGDLLITDGSSSNSLVRKSDGTSYGLRLIGVVSTNPGLVSGGGEAEKEHGLEHGDVLVALAGRVPVKVSTENGPITVGDRITSSSIPGVGMKATTSGMTIGIALEPYNSEGIGKIMVFVNVGEGNVAAMVKELKDEIKALQAEMKDLRVSRN